jgi:hypothetical protein
VLRQDRVEPSHVALLVDASVSMQTRESYRDASLAEALAAGAGLRSVNDVRGESRLDLVKLALKRDEGAALRRLLDPARAGGVQLLAFGRHVTTQGFYHAAGIDGGSGGEPGASERLADALGRINANEPTTDLVGAIRDVLENARGRRLSAIVLASDGAASGGVHPTALRDVLDEARDRQTPIFPLRIGSPATLRDVELAAVRAEASAFMNDMLAVEARIIARGLTEPTELHVRLLDASVGGGSDDAHVLAVESLTIEPSGEAAVVDSSVELRFKPERAGALRLRVEVLPIANERTLDNNAQEVDVRILEDRLRVLYVEGYPRYEYRYLKNALLREPTVELSVLLLEADESFVQEGSDPVRRFPDTPEELNQFDVVLFGDVDPRAGWLTHAQTRMLLDFVGNRGGGFGLIAGERWAPHRFVGTGLERLVPVRIDPSFTGRYDRTLISGFRPQLTPEGQMCRMFRFEEDRETKGRRFDALPELYWVCRTLGAKPGCTVLAEYPRLRAGAEPMPLFVVGRYGAGAIFFQGTDDTWRWRRHSGELLHDTYWVQVVRELMRGSRVSMGRRFDIRADRRSYPYGSPIRVQVEVVDAPLAASLGDTIELSVVGIGADAGVDSTQDEPSGVRAADEGAVSPTGLVGRFAVSRLSPESSVFEGAWVAPTPGRLAIEAADLTARPGELPPSVLVQVQTPNLEAQRPEADHAVLEQIAEATGGRVIGLDALEAGFGQIRNRSVLVPDDIVEPLWDSRLALILFATMISMEWVLRKAFGLV